MLRKKKISIIIPCRNEEAALYSMLQNVPSCVDEIIVVDNGSTDNTVFVAETLGAKVISEKKEVDGVGYGFAHKAGMKAAKGDIIVALDGDGTYPIEKIPEIISFMENAHLDFVSCARFPLSDSGAISSTRKLGVKVLNLETSLLFGYPMKDILSGMWVMKKECIRKMKIRSGEWNFSPEIKIAALMHPKIHFSEYHISHSVRFNGVSKQNIWKTGFNHLQFIVALRFRYMHIEIPNVLQNINLFTKANLKTRQVIAKISI